MKHLCMPASYARVPVEEQHLIYGGSEFGSAWSAFTSNLQFGDFVFGGGLLSFSISFVPLLLFNVIRTGYSVAQSLYRKAGSFFGYRDEALDDLQTYTETMRTLRSKP